MWAGSTVLAVDANLYLNFNSSESIYRPYRNVFLLKCSDLNEQELL